MVQAGIIRPSTSAFCAPTFCVKKPVGWRIVHDYRQLNSATILPAIPMPRKEDTFDAMGGSYWFSCMDLLWGYYQVKLRESDIPFTAFSTPDGIFEYLVTSMGLSGNPATFNRLLQHVFSDLRDVMRIVPRYSVNNGVLYYQTRDDVNPRLVIPDNEDLKNRVICENHDVVTAGHPGYFKTYLGVQKKYYWPKMSKYIQRYVNTCELCQRNKARQTKPPGLLQPLDIPEGRWVDISMDFMTALPRTTAGKDAVMVIVDRLTKRAKFIATNTTATAEDTATLFMVNYVKDHGVPKSIISDRDSKFTSKFWQDAITTLETTHQLSSVFRPQTEGQTERTNRFVEDYLRGVVNPAQNDWDEYLHLAGFAYNRRVHASIRMSPFEADLGYVPYMPDDVTRDPEFDQLNKTAQEFLVKQDALLKMAQDAMSEAQTRMKSYYDKNIIAQHFKTGDL
ncbi:Retroelement, partial [Phytophthora megakarya]